MITAKELAEKLNGIAYGDSFDDVKQEAKESGLVIVYGASDDLMEFDGAIYDEGGFHFRSSIENTRPTQ